MSKRLFNAPIPGENLTSASKNYSWHRPAQYPDFDDAIEHIIDDVLSNKDKIAGIVAMTSNGISALVIVQSVLTAKVGKGVISPDMTLLLAGPFYKLLTKILDGLGIEYLTGFDTREELNAYIAKLGSRDILLKPVKKQTLTKEQVEEMERITEEAKEEIPVGGLMGAPMEEKT